MGTRADFYVGDGDSAEWLGSIAWDGYRDGIPDEILVVTDESQYRALVGEFIKGRKDGTTPEMGWPWPWNDSGTTDCCYAFKAGKVECGSWGVLYDKDESDCAEGEETKAIGGNFPDMSSRKNMTLGPRSGVTFVEYPDLTTNRR